MRKNRLFELTEDTAIAGMKETFHEGRARSNKEELKEIFANDIELIIEKELAQYKQALKDDFAKQFSVKISEAQSRFELEQKKTYDINKKLEYFFTQADIGLAKKINQELDGVAEIIVLLVMKSLFHISSSEAINKTIIENIVKLTIEKVSLDPTVTLLVSAVDYELISESASFEQVKSFLRIDSSLVAGQVTLDDKISLGKVGLLDRLDALRSAFVVALENKNAL
jgi:hypothetical protein